MKDILESVVEAKKAMSDDGKKDKLWQKKIKTREPQQITCPHDKKLRCTLTIPSKACLKCEIYIGKNNGPGAV